MRWHSFGVHQLRIIHQATNWTIRPAIATSANCNSRMASNYAGLLYLQKSDRSMVPATEADFFNYTRKRWLFNESYELNRRYIRFDIQGLFNTAAEAINNGATRCARAVKLLEGEYNKAFLLIMDNGTEVVAKLPNPNAGPKHYTTASEVATIDFLRTAMSIPIPRILAWSSSTTNAVGSEYIIMEKARGVLLSDVWYQLERDCKNEILQQLVELQIVLASQRGQAHGCVFYTDDVPAKWRLPFEFSAEPSQKFVIGPSVDRKLWEDGRELLKFSKGPWFNMIEYAIDLGNMEQQWVRKHAQPRMNYFRDDEFLQQPSQTLELLEKYLLLFPAILKCPEDLDHLTKPILSHPDLHLSNVFIDPDTKKFTSIIDWQGTEFSPLVLQAQIPRMVRHLEPLQIGLFMPQKPGNYHELNLGDKQAADSMHTSALCQKYYEVLIAKLYPHLYTAMLHNETRKAPFIEPLQAVTGSWENREEYKLRSSLIRVMEHWDELETGLQNCPINFDQEDIKKHDEELENLDYVQSMMEAFDEEGILPADGRVNPDAFEALRTVNQEQKLQFLSMAEDEHQKCIMEKTWPWQDWPERMVDPGQ